ncbi:MAG: nucleoside deaminase [Alphaproteobacteria bacterium]|nr:nucleoside deaminase [Alphaproteobacteria bacterium]
MDNEKYMLLALKEAQKAAIADEVPVGAVLVDSQTGKIIAKAHNKTEHGLDPTAHAEISVIRKASKKLKTKRLWGTTLFVTLEPCAMCAAAISFARIENLVIGATDEKSGAVLNGVRFFESKTCHFKPQIISGVLEKKSAELLKDFFKNKRG